MEFKKTGEEYDPKTKTRTTYYDVFFQAPSRYRINTEITNNYNMYFEDSKDSTKSYPQVNLYFEGVTRDWKNTEVTKKYDFGFRIFGRVIGIVYRPSTILWWFKKWLKEQGGLK